MSTKEHVMKEYISISVIKLDKASNTGKATNTIIVISKCLSKLFFNDLICSRVKLI